MPNEIVSDDDIEPADQDHKLKDLIHQLASVNGVKQVHEISTNYVKGKLYVTLHAYVNPELSVEESHRLAEIIRWENAWPRGRNSRTSWTA